MCVGLCLSCMVGLAAAAAGDVRVLLIQIALMLLSLAGTEIVSVVSILSHTSMPFHTGYRLSAFLIWS